ncbi:MAG: MtrB/PioB family decaheme-associated outer membrane protein [Rhodoferax sp.]|uniref:MtrB/PioB family decaheme-associated outer membrane protein n=1 Tax=Rhodoferax sp. TaxID=50421 RepID=UPI003BAF1D24
MIRPHSMFTFQRTALALAACAALFPAHAQSPAETTLSGGLGVFNEKGAERALFNQYRGIDKDNSVAAMLDIDYSLRQGETGDWVDFQGYDLLGDTRELNLVWKKPGDWKLTAEYGGLVRNEPNQVNTGLLNLGSTTPVVVALPAGTGANVDLQTKRTKLGVGYTKIISPRMQLVVDLKTEKKEGSRLFGMGFNCATALDPACLGSTATSIGWASLMLPEPIDANHSQLEARLSYALEKLRFSVGYYGSFYRNANTSLNPSVSGSLYDPVGTLLPASASLLGYLNQSVALSPDNQAHQLDLSGNYDFTDKTRANFKLAYSTASQDDGFSSPSRTGLTSLGGQVDTKLAQFGITSRPMPKLSLLANVRYQDKDDKTPIAYYNLDSVGGSLAYTNRSLSNRKTAAKMQAGWQFNPDYRGTVGVDHEAIDRGEFTATSAIAGTSALRQETNETTVRAELRRRMSENMSGAISLSSSERDGSGWLKDNAGLGVTEVSANDPSLATAVFMPTLADRQRDKVKLQADWTPNKDLSLQFSAEAGTDKYNTPSVYGLHDTRMNQLNLDWAYALSSKWALNGYVSRGLQTFNQTRDAGYVMSFENTSASIGLGFTGKPTSQLQVGGTLSYVNDTSEYTQGLDSSAGAYSAASLAASGGLPDITFRQTALKLFGSYALDKKSAVRVDLIHQKSSYNDWAWSYNGVPYRYSDGTTVTQNADQSVSYIGVTYIYELK